MHIFSNPVWIDSNLLHKKSLDEVSEEELKQLNARLEQVITSERPEVSVCIAAWNEELNLIKCLDSLSRTMGDVPFEILVVNNNSTDRTQQVLDQLCVRSAFQPVQGCGVSRQLGQEQARGTYILSADADCYYPATWVETMYQALCKPGVALVYSRHSFLGDEDIPRWKYFLYELGKDLMIELRHFKRPYLNVYGMSLGYKREEGLKEGFVTRNIRGEDGRMCFDLMKYGKVKLLRSQKVRIWTSDRNLEKDGSLMKAITKRMMKEVLNIGKYMRKADLHNTKTSENNEKTREEYKDALKAKLSLWKKNSG